MYYCLHFYLLRKWSSEKYFTHTNWADKRQRGIKPGFIWFLKWYHLILFLFLRNFAFLSGYSWPKRHWTIRIPVIGITLKMFQKCDKYWHLEGTSLFKLFFVFWFFFKYRLHPSFHPHLTPRLFHLQWDGIPLFYLFFYIS